MFIGFWNKNYAILHIYVKILTQETFVQPALWYNAIH